MKKIILLLVMAVFTATVVSAQNNQLDKKTLKTISSDAKKQAKKLTDEGWTLDGSGTLESALYRHMVKKETNGLQEMSPIGQNAVSINQGNSVAMFNAAREYSQEAGSKFKGVMAQSGMNVQAEEDNAAANENTSQQFTQLIENEIQGELVKSFGIYRKLANGKYEYQVFLLIDPKAAANARKRVLNNMRQNNQFTEETIDAINKAFENN